jgi:hypothetical protein
MTLSVNDTNDISTNVRDKDCTMLVLVLMLVVELLLLLLLLGVVIFGAGILSVMCN